MDFNLQWKYSQTKHLIYVNKFNWLTRAVTYSQIYIRRENPNFKLKYFFNCFFSICPDWAVNPWLILGSKRELHKTLDYITTMSHFHRPIVCKRSRQWRITDENVLLTVSVTMSHQTHLAMLSVMIMFSLFLRCLAIWLPEFRTSNWTGEKIKTLLFLPPVSVWGLFSLSRRNVSRVWQTSCIIFLTSLSRKKSWECLKFTHWTLNSRSV